MESRFLTAWRFWDSIYYRFTRLQYVDVENGNLFRVVVKPYRGETIITSDGVRLERGDLYAKLHLYNVGVACLLRQHVMNKGLGTGLAGELAILKKIRSSFPALSSFISDHPRSSEIKALMGITFLNRGVEKLGFESKELSNPLISQLKAHLFKFILICCHPRGWTRLKEKSRPLVPKRVYISKDAFVHRFKAGGIYG